MIIQIKTRDINGKRSTHRFSSESDVCRRVLAQMTEEDEVLSVVEDGACLYSALASDKSLTAEDLTGFFG